MVGDPMMSTATLPLSTKEQIVLAAERLFAERGYEGVSLREIGAAAGSGNNSAVQYHFGSKEQLVVAIFENRLTYIDDRRAILIAQLEPPTSAPGSSATSFPCSNKARSTGATT